eukprot:scaffold24848_cov174-Isochrysis_galbana.AAC.3
MPNIDYSGEPLLVPSRHPVLRAPCCAAAPRASPSAPPPLRFREVQEEEGGGGSLFTIYVLYSSTRSVV